MTKSPDTSDAEYMPERREMMQAWADWIDELAKKAAENDLQPKGRKEK